jgi:hypothetical protein
MEVEGYADGLPNVSRCVVPGLLVALRHVRMDIASRAGRAIVPDRRRSGSVLRRQARDGVSGLIVDRSARSRRRHRPGKKCEGAQERPHGLTVRGQQIRTLPSTVSVFAEACREHAGPTQPCGNARPCHRPHADHLPIRLKELENE